MVKSRPLSKEQLKTLINTTYFTKAQILTIFKKFQALDPDRIPSDMSTQVAQSVTVPKEVVIKSIPELQFNPFADRILYIFSYNRYIQPGALAFYNYVDLYHFLDTKTDTSLKLFHAFRIFDVDNDGEISGPDCFECVDRLCDGMMTREETSRR